ncbi:MAG: hypothetical protein ALAOOOJD_00514 [bacterium]|nr:hypothetical protein [bacterium]
MRVILDPIRIKGIEAVDAAKKHPPPGNGALMAGALIELIALQTIVAVEISETFGRRIKTG